MNQEYDENPIEDADKIIERFGGIRPMAAKLGVPVTTVQGWKKRNVIPGNRRADILRIATENNIDMGEHLAMLTRKSAPPRSMIEYDEDAPRVKKASVRNVWQNQGVLLSSIALLGVAGLGVFLLAKPHHVSQQDQQIAALQKEIEDLKQQQQKEAIAPPVVESEAVNSKINAIQSTVQTLESKAQSVSAAIDDLQEGKLKERLESMEASVKGMVNQANAMGLNGLLQKVTVLQQTPEGQMMLSSIVGSFAANAQGENPEAQLQALREKDPAIAQALEGVAPEDMKAAAMLIGFAQMRNALARDKASFDQDLALLSNIAAKDDPVLQEAIARLAPQAKSGVFTPQGLSKEFRGMAGDIVVSSLSGQNVSIEEKAKARLGQVFQVEKSGQQITGTETQIAVAEAQKRLDAGDVGGAVQILQGLQGPAAQTAQPFLQQAQMTMLAQQVQQALGHNVLGALTQNKTAYTTGPGMGNVLNQVQQMIPGYGMTHDPNSGFRMYRAPPLVPGQ